MIEKVNIHLSETLNRQIKYFTLINEPNTFLAAFYLNGIFGGGQHIGPEFLTKAYDNLFSTYVKLYDKIHDLYEKNAWGAIDLANNSASSFTYEIDKMWLDILRLRHWGVKKENMTDKINECKEGWYKRIDALAKHFLKSRSLKPMMAQKNC
jgi:beta-glucosidase/6-phospho-beta-glucosidase/beta-galactosidase